MFRHPLHTGAQRAGTADDQVDLHSGLRGRIQRADRRFVGQRIHLGDHARRPAAAGDRDFVRQRPQQLLVHRERRDPQVLQAFDLGQARQVQENSFDIAADLRIRGQHAEVRVQLGRHFVVVARAQVRIWHEPRAAAQFLPSQHQRHLRVSLESDDAVNDLRTDRFEPLGKVDVRLLVEARLQFDDDGHFLAAPRCLFEDVDHHRADAGPVQRHADRRNLRIGGRLAQELDHRLEALIGMVDQQVALLYRLEQVGALSQLARPGRHEWRPAQLRVLDVIDQLVHPHQVDRPVDLEHGFARQLELFLQMGLQRRRTGAQHFEPDRVAEVALREFHPHRLAQVVHLALIDRQIGIARHPELGKPADLPAREEFLQVRANRRRQQHKCLFARRELRRQRDHPRQHARDLQDRDSRWSPEGVLALELDDEVQRLVQHLRERVRGVEADRRQQRSHFALEIVTHPGALLRIALRVIDDHDAMPFERRHDRPVVEVVLPLDQAMRTFDHHRIRRCDRARRAGANLLGQVRHPDLEEFIEVGRDDADVAQPLRQRNRSTQGHRQHAFVERKQRQLPVQVRLRGWTQL